MNGTVFAADDEISTIRREGESGALPQSCPPVVVLGSVRNRVFDLPRGEIDEPDVRGPVSADRQSASVRRKREFGDGPVANLARLEVEQLFAAGSFANVDQTAFAAIG